jgi:pyruvate/2-oxoglutarate dehydrogenase complex dihydrolipoamide acyltransferase (E2) component
MNASMTPEDTQDKTAPPDKSDASQGAPTGAPAAPAGATPLAADAHSASAPKGASDARGGAEGAGARSAPASPTAAKPASTAGAPAAVKAAAPQPPPPPPPKPQPIDEFDPLGWDVPLICKDCDKPFVVPYRNFHAGVVFHCPSCQGSWVPNSTIAKEMRQVFEGFWGPRKRAREAFERGELKLDRAEFERRQAEELKAFKERLERLAAELKPAGKLVRPKGLAAMFT